MLQNKLINPVYAVCNEVSYMTVYIKANNASLDT